MLVGVTPPVRIPVCHMRTRLHEGGGLQASGVGLNCNTCDGLV